jgi:hypothetical protein
MPRRFRHKSERYAVALILRCKVCAEHCETACVTCRRPVCLRHNVATALSATILCGDCGLAAHSAKGQSKGTQRAGEHHHRGVAS